ncbi:hypothetical protein E2562_011733 [Oryza meyeriana var. granulata]|uniref:Uncharacterized protein n=1 Tax=Oryza meyeriana var. granulata TaxID=110450 RepID=A0A6G1DGV5_9ORYZ|nr:hypothetical protein E2562_011733 [Oryza meyeriana var. granulata]
MAKTSRRDTAMATNFGLTGRRMRTLRRQPHGSGRRQWLSAADGKQGRHIGVGTTDGSGR